MAVRTLPRDPPGEEGNTKTVFRMTQEGPPGPPGPKTNQIKKPRSLKELIEQWNSFAPLEQPPKNIGIALNYHCLLQNRGVCKMAVSYILVLAVL